MNISSVESLLIRIAALEADNRLLRASTEAAACLHLIDARHLDDMRASTAVMRADQETKMDWAALASSQAETKAGQTNLRASETALASSQAETKTSRTNLRASETALASSRAETKTSRTNLRASETALASSRAETKAGQSNLLISETALATSRAETRIGLDDLAVSETANIHLEILAHELSRARDAAERANRVKSRFLAGMSHELRTPLNGILGYAQLLRLDGDLNEVQSARVSSMLSAGMHLLEMIEGVLDLSEIESGRVELHVADVNPRHVADACLDLVRPAAEAKKLALGLSIAPDVPRDIRTDPKRLRQVLSNLLGNAVKFTSQGTVDLRVRTAGDGATLRLEVADTGPGIPAKHRHELFHDFARLDAGSNINVEGAGLGLSLSKQIAAMMGGRIGCDANPEGGSLFWLELPLTGCGAAGTDPVMGSAPDVPHIPSIPMRPLRVLVVDDIAMNRDIAASFIGSVGHEVVCAEGGAEAIQAVTAEDFDVVMMDVRMPEMDGLEATRRIRALEKAGRRVPIVAMTAQVFSEQIKECRDAGMDGHLAKPFTLESLLLALASSQVGRDAGAAVEPGLKGRN